MPVSSRELAGSAYDALTRRELEDFLEVIDPGVEFNSLIAEADTRTFHGHDGVREWWEMVQESLGGLRFDIHELTEITPRTGYTRIWASGEVAGVEVGQTMWQAYRTDGERIVWWQVYRAEQEAREGAEKVSR